MKFKDLFLPLDGMSKVSLVVLDVNMNIIKESGIKRLIFFEDIVSYFDIEVVNIYVSIDNVINITLFVRS